MTRIRVKGFKIFNDRHGKPRCYHRATNHKVDLEKAPLGSAEFFAECAKITALAEAMKAKAPKPGTLGGLTQSYFQTEHFANLADATKRDYRKCADFLHPIRDTPVASINTPLVAGMHDKAAEKIGWRRANMVRTFLSQVFRYAIPKGLIDQDYAKGVIPKPRPKDLPYANRPWTIEEQKIVLESAQPHVRVAVALIMNTGLDPSDALKLTRRQIDGNTIWGVRGKTGEEVAIPIGARLQAALDAAPVHHAVTILATSTGKPWTYNGFSTVWYRFKKKLECKDVVQPGLTLKGLRHTVATTLREAGLDERQIADLLGQKTPSMARHYSRSANLADRNRITMETLEKENERRSKVVKPFKETVKPRKTRE
ncbi:tyrosine-type recombinase/integrase [Shimia sediminis]|uniref:tyrosine-type recombinase/integrase n=1 Tax=Shimia sediminis TaxID=2497945 RepID=UPI000F8CC6B6|nr:tyrosine-type recombinase/integrase [Shimia sediminis]